MKKKLLFISLGLISFFNANAQELAGDPEERIRIGVKAGLNLSNVYDSRGQQFNADAKFGFAVGGFLSIPFGELIDVEGERNKIQDEIKYAKGFLASVQAKLSNERFMAGAPEQVVAVERQKESDALQKLALLESRLSALK